MRARSTGPEGQNEQKALRRSVAGILVVGAAVLGATPAPAVGGAGHGAALRVVAGRVSVDATHLTGTGWFVVANRGMRRAPRSLAALVLSNGSRNRVLATYRVRALGPGRSTRVGVQAQLPALGSGSPTLSACAGYARRRALVRSRCRLLARLRVNTTGGGTTTVPTNPIPYTVDQPIPLPNAQTPQYWVTVPKAYDATGQTPIKLLVWMHGCYGDAQGDSYLINGSDPHNPYTIDPNRDYLAISVDGASGGNNCWDTSAACGDCAKITNALADVETHFNIDRRRVLIGGYSSGGDMAYRIAFYHATLFAGVLTMNTSPFRDTGSSEQASLAAASWHFHIVHLAHNQDQVYPLAGVQQEISAVQRAWGADAGRVQLLTTDGQHYDDPGQDGDTLGTAGDLVQYVLPHINDGWVSPGS